MQAEKPLFQVNIVRPHLVTYLLFCMAINEAQLQMIWMDEPCPCHACLWLSDRVNL